MQKVLTFTCDDGSTKEFLTNIREINVTSLGEKNMRYMYAPQSVVTNVRTIGFDLSMGFTDPESGKYFKAPNLN
ncbi:hypothetical protein [Acinetobacter rudis]|uniref:hypothetical protein n=1 Tax=Acinetobacter rudis TaxID=632955 RepID=UPI00334223B1